jgi:hypothetical protein
MPSLDLNQFHGGKGVPSILLDLDIHGSIKIQKIDDLEKRLSFSSPGL